MNKKLSSEISTLLKDAASKIETFIETQENKDFDAVKIYKIWHVVNRDMVDEYSGEADFVDFLAMLSDAFRKFSEVK